MSEARARIAYVVTLYPAISHTFVQREIASVRRAGIEVLPISIRRAQGDHVLSGSEQSAAQETVTIQPVSLRRAVRAWVVPLLTSPRAVFKVLRLALSTGGSDVRELLWRVFHFGEALVLWRELDARGIRHVHAHFANVSSNLAWFATEFGNARSPRGPRWSWSFTMHGSSEFLAEKLNRLGQKAETARFTICISDYTRAQMIKLAAPEHWDHIHVIHCGVDPSEFSPRSGSGSHDWHVLAVGRLSPEKGYTVLVEAVALLRQRGVPVHLDLVGGGSEQANIEAAIARHGVADAVTLHGPIGQDDVPAYFDRADAYVLSSFIEGLPVVLMEALACELPAVASGINGVPELVVDGVTGLTVTPGRADQLADALARLYADPALAARLGAAGRQKVIDEFDINRMGEQVAALFDRYVTSATSETSETSATTDTTEMTP